MLKAAVVVGLLTLTGCASARQQVINEHTDCLWYITPQQQQGKMTPEEAADWRRGCEALYRMRMQKIRQ